MPPTACFFCRFLCIRLCANATYLQHGDQGHPKGTAWVEILCEGQGSTLLTESDCCCRVTCVFSTEIWAG